MSIKKLIFAGLLTIVGIPFSDAIGSDSMDLTSDKTPKYSKLSIKTKHDNKLIFNNTTSIFSDTDLLDNDSLVSEEKLIPFQTISNPDEIYEKILESETLRGTVFIFDVDGTLSNEEDPKFYNKVTPRGNAVNNIRKMRQKGAIIYYCSAWNKIEETIGRLYHIGFTNEDLGIENKSKSEYKESKKIKLSRDNFIELSYMKHGKVISTKLNELWGKYYRNKAFAPFIDPTFNIEQVKEIYFFDDSSENISFFQNDLHDYKPYPNITTYIYKINIKKRY